MIILASGSPQRRKILKKWGIRFRAVASRVPETPDGLRRPHAIARHLALKKAREIFKRYPKATVIGVDTLVVLPSGAISGKPENRKTARKVLKSYQNAHCDVYSGVAVVGTGGEWSAWERTRLRFGAFRDREIDDYLTLNEWQGSSGAMTIEGGAGNWIRSMEGEYWNVVGLPMERLMQLLTYEKNNRPAPSAG